LTTLRGINGRFESSSRDPHAWPRFSHLLEKLVDGSWRLFNGLENAGDKDVMGHYVAPTSRQKQKTYSSKLLDWRFWLGVVVDALRWLALLRLRALPVHEVSVGVLRLNLPELGVVIVVPSAGHGLTDDFLSEQPPRNQCWYL
jgi:hypothetical protein